MICDDCVNYKLFGKKCWFWWPNKRVCTYYKKEYPLSKLEEMAMKVSLNKKETQPQEETAKA